jgi:hypothetical protein
MLHIIKQRLHRRLRWISMSILLVFWEADDDD